MAKTIMYEGIDELEAIKGRLVLVESEKARVTELDREQTVLTKGMESRKKEMNAEIEETVKKRKAELEFSYDREIKELNRGKKKVKNNKEREKGEKVTEKVVIETSEYYDKIKNFRLEMKRHIRDNKLPFFVGSDFFYAIFIPKTFFEFLLALFVFMVIFVALPYPLYTAFEETMPGSIAPMVVYVIDILVFGGLYVAINTSVKERRRDDIAILLGYRQEIRNVKKEIKKVKKGIADSEDESEYGLEAYDEELAGMDSRLRGLSDEQREAMLHFNMETRAAITEEIKSRFEPEINQMKAKYDSLLEEERRLKEHIQLESLELSRKYEAQIGKANMTSEAIDRLILIIQSDRARTISEALIVDRADKLAEKNGGKKRTKSLKRIAESEPIAKVEMPVAQKETIYDEELPESKEVPQEELSEEENEARREWQAFEDNKKK